MTVEYRQKYSSFLKVGNESEYLEGTLSDQAVILIHGFMASPFEVKEVALKLNSLGYTVYMPLLYGFGADLKTANEAKLEIWKRQIKESVEKLSHCYKKISIGGISLGAALATDYVLNNNAKNITSLILLSPYFDVSHSVAKLLIGPLSNITNSVDLSTLYTISRSLDLIEVLKNKTYYVDAMPFFALQEIFKLSNELLIKKSSKLISIPVLVAKSDADTTIDLNQVISLPQKHFKDISYFNIEKSMKVPHQITYEIANPKFKEMMRKMINVIRKGSYQSQTE